MNRRAVFFLVIALTAALALGGVLLAQAAQASAGSDPSPGAGYRVDVGGWQASGVLSGAGYRLDPAGPLPQQAGSGWRVLGDLSGDGYRLEAPDLPEGTGTPCCCLFLPCIKR